MFKEITREKIESLKQYDGNDRIVSSLDHIEYIENTVKVIPPYYCGIKTLDKMIDGFVPGELIILSGVPGHGKSLFMKTLINNLYERHIFSLVLSYEESDYYFYQKFPDGGREVLFYVPREKEAFDYDWVVDRIIEAKYKVGASVVFIDHGEFIFNSTGQNNQANYIKQIIKHLKFKIAVDFQLCVFLIWHLKKEQINYKEQLTPDLLVDSAGLHQNCDTLLYLFRDVKDEGTVIIEEGWIVVGKARRTGVMKAYIPIVKNNYFLYETEGNL